MEIVKTYTCPCSPGKFFSSSSGLSQHRKTKKHLAYEVKTKDQKVIETKRDNEILTLKMKITDRDEQIEKLIMEKHDLQEKNKKVLEYEIYNGELCSKLEFLVSKYKHVKNENQYMKRIFQTLKKDV